jgi:hypothetical protein
MIEEENRPDAMLSKEKEEILRTIKSRMDLKYIVLVKNSSLVFSLLL